MEENKQKDLKEQALSSIQIPLNNNIDLNGLAEPAKNTSEDSKKTVKKEIESFLESPSNLNEKSEKTEVNIFLSYLNRAKYRFQPIFINRKSEVCSIQAREQNLLKFLNFLFPLLNLNQQALKKAKLHQ